MNRSTERLLTSHTGSLPRPQEIVDVMVAHQQGAPIDDAARERIAAAIVDVVARQRETGIDIVDDGEFSKPGFANYIIDRLEGLGGEAESISFHDMDEMPQVAARFSSDRAHVVIPCVVGDLRYVGSEDVQRDIATLQRALETNGVDVAHGFLPAASPGILAMRMTNQHYPDYETYLMALADAMSEEYRTIAESGLTVQLDCPDIPFSNPRHSRFWASETVERMGHPDFVRLHADAIAHATRDVPRERLRLHLCWGNYEGPHHYDVPLWDVLGPVLERTRASAISFESANPRHEHEWSLLPADKVPDDVVLMPGMINTVTNFIEHPEVVAQRLERWAGVVGRERVIGGTDCGFGTWAGLGQVAAPAAWLKLRSLAEGAALASSRLW